MQQLELCQRQVHLDFHTGPDIPAIGADFDPQRFASTMKNAHINSVTVFAKCHHGLLYYPSKSPAVHPHLQPGLDLCGEQIKALHAVGIRAPVYVSVQCDEFAANTHPEWIALDSSLKQVKGGGDAFKPGWQILDMSSPYLDYLIAQIEEVMLRYHPVDGMFFDMCWNQVSCSNWAKAGMLAKGLNPEDPEQRTKYAAEVARSYMETIRNLVGKIAPDATCYFNSRPLSNLANDIAYLTHTEIEALATGGWGYMYFPKNVRYVRTFKWNNGDQGKPYMGMTGRFHKSWGDFGSIKPRAALLYEVAQMLAHGATCSIGDQLHPSGAPDQAVYDLIGSVYEHAEKCEPWTHEARPLADVGVFRADISPSIFPTDAKLTDDGVTRMLTHLKVQFDIIDPNADFSHYRTLILPDSISIDTATAEKINAYIKNGGTLIVSGTSGLGADYSANIPNLPLTITEASPYDTVYLRAAANMSNDVPRTDHVLYTKTLRATTTADATTLTTIVEPYFNRAWNHFCSHYQTPNKLEASPYAAIAQKGQIVQVAFPIFAAFGEHCCLVYRTLLRNALERLLPNPLIQAKTAPSTCEITVTRQPGRIIVHLLQFVADRRHEMDICEDIIPLHNLPISIRTDSEPKSVYTAPDKKALDFSYAAGYVSVTIPIINGHQMIVCES